jgi:hypothetical protein
MRVLVVIHYYSTHRGRIELIADHLASLVGHQHNIVWAASDCDLCPADLEVRVLFLPMRTSNIVV